MDTCMVQVQVGTAGRQCTCVVTEGRWKTSPPALSTELRKYEYLSLKECGSHNYFFVCPPCHALAHLRVVNVGSDLGERAFSLLSSRRSRKKQCGKLLNICRCYHEVNYGIAYSFMVFLRASYLLWKGPEQTVAIPLNGVTSMGGDFSAFSHF